MKILDRYIAKHFLMGFLISFSVLVGLRIVIDLFVNLDEFVEDPNLSTFDIIRHTAYYYGINITLYVREFAAMITVVAAAFSIGKLVRSNELIAIMASGVSLKRIVAPILVMAILLTGLAVVNQEILIPRFSNDLVLKRDQAAKKNEAAYFVWFLSDKNNSLICADEFSKQKQAFSNITIITREEHPHRKGIFRVTGRIHAERATYNRDTKAWDLTEGKFIAADNAKGAEAINEYKSPGLIPEDIPVRVMADISLLSWKQLGALSTHNKRDIARIYSQRNFRITEHIINLVMLLVSLPVLMVRDPRGMKTAVLISFGLTAACTVVTFACKMLSTETTIFSSLAPEFWAWLPVFIFLPIAFIELDAMKT